MKQEAAAAKQEILADIEGQGKDLESMQQEMQKAYPPKFQNGAAVRKVALESCRTLLSLPAMTRLSEDARAKLPEATQKLADQYTALLNQVHQKIYPPAPQQ